MKVQSIVDTHSSGFISHRNLVEIFILSLLIMIVTLLKWLLFLQIEGCNQEVYEDMYCTYTGMLSKESNQDSDFCYKTYKQKSGIITLKETSKLVCDGTTGLRTWEVTMTLLF